MSAILNFSPQKSFYPAILKKYKSIGYVIEWYFYDDESGKMIRRMVKMNHIYNRTTQHDFRAYVSNMIIQINKELTLAYPESGLAFATTSTMTAASYQQVKPESGLAFVAPTEKPKKVVSIKETTQKFIEEKEKELRADTLRSYRSFCKILLEWCTIEGKKQLSAINRDSAVEFMDYIYHEREVSAVSYNNYLKLARCFLSWCMSKNLTDNNPFQLIKKKRTDGKNRTLICSTDRARLMENDKIAPNYKIICMLVFSALLRPKEISKLQVKHVHLERGYIDVPGSVAKNHKRRCAALTPQLVEWLSRMNLDRYSPNYYLFGSHLTPDKEPCGALCYMKYWRKVRKLLDYPINYTLYSFRDTGITEMLESGMPSVDVMKHADHSSLDITTTYVQHEDKELIRKIATHAPKF